MTLILSCGVDKNNKLRPVTGFMKDLSSQYNAHYNANVMIDEYLLNAQSNSVENYDDILPVFGYLKDTSGQGGASGLDTSLITAKMTRLASYKRPSKWTDDSYLVYGRAMYLAGDYLQAENTFKYVVQNYRPQDLEHIYHYKEDNSRRRLYALARLEQEEARKADKIQRDLEKAQKIKEREQIKLLRKKEGKMAEKRKKLEQQEREDERKAQVKAREELRKEREKARKKGDRSYDREKIAQRRKELEEEMSKPKEKKQSKKEKYEEREERLRLKRLALLNKDSLRTDDEVNRDSFELDEITFEADIVKEIKDTLTYDEKRELIEERRQREAEENGDTLSNDDQADSLIASVDEEFVPQEATRSMNNIYFFDEAFYGDKQTDINSTNKGLMSKISPHHPAYYDALVYLASTKNQLGAYYESEAYLKELFRYELPHEVQDHAYLVIAENFIARKDYGAAEKALQYALEATHIDRVEKGRIAFIRAQLIERMGYRDEAKEAFEDVQKYHPGKEMELRAKIKILALSTTSSNLDAIDKQLRRLAKDEENESFRDIIYLELALASIKNRDIKTAKEALQKSSAYNKSRPYEKYKALALLSDISIREDDYVLAHHYADTIAALQASDQMKNYDKYVKRKQDLNDIAEGILIIKDQDSLLALSQLSEKELKKRAKKLLKEERQKEIAAQIRDERKSERGTLNKINTQPLKRNVDSDINTFFAYDASLVKDGYRKFRKEWDKRPLVDNWRFSSLMDPADVAEAEGRSSDEEDNSDFSVSDSDVEAVFGDVPRTEEERQEVMATINEALLLAGRAFTQNDVSINESNNYLKKLLTQKPEEELQKEALYFLYQNAMQVGDQALANQYKTQLDQLEEGYSPFGEEEVVPDLRLEPRSDYYGDQYAICYQRFEKGDYKGSYTLINDILDSLSSAHILTPKFKLLKAMNIGHLSGRDGYISSLKDLRNDHRHTVEGKKADEILKLLGDASASTGESINSNSGGEFDDNIEFDRHYVFIQLDEPYKALGLRNRIDEYHQKNGYTNLQLGFVHMTPTKVIPEKTVDGELKKPKEKKATCIQVKVFESMEKAMAYYSQAQANIEEYMTEPENFSMFVASQKNFRILQGRKASIEEYLPFFRNLYLD